MLDRRHLIRIALVASTLLVSGCTTSVVVKSDIPTPLVNKLPIKGSMKYTDEFKNYVYTEKEKKRSLKKIDFTDAQITMFDRVFGSLIDLVPADATAQDLFIEPEILDVQYTAPSETKLNQYEIWIKYRLKLTDDKGDKIADWIIKGYGKTPTAMLSSASSGFNAASNVALRDVGAQLAIGFGRQSKIKALIANNAPESDVSPESQSDTAKVVIDDEKEELEK